MRSTSSRTSSAEPAAPVVTTREAHGFVLQEARYQPGYRGGVHRHPSAYLGYVVAGDFMTSRTLVALRRSRASISSKIPRPPARGIESVRLTSPDSSSASISSQALSRRIATTATIGRGGFAEAVIRMLIILAGTRGAIRRDRLVRSSRVISCDEPFASLGPEKRAALIHEQTVIVEFERERAIETLPLLLTTPEQRQKAIDVVQYIAGAVEEMEPYTIQTMQRFRSVFGLSPLEMRVPTKDPLQQQPDSAESAAA